MAIRNQNEPMGGRDIINAALSSRLPRARNLFALGGAAAQMGRALPIYMLTLEDAAASEPLTHAKLTGWRYPIVGGPVTGLASLAGSSSEGAHYAGITHGILPDRLLQAAAFAEAKLGPVPDEYEPRLLEAPSLKIYCLWFAGSSNFFVSLMDGQPPGTAPLKMETDISARIRDAMAVSRSPAVPLGGSPTN
jgi:hypothetical protein